MEYLIVCVLRITIELHAGQIKANAQTACIQHTRLITINNLGGLLYAKGDPGSAEAMLRLALELTGARGSARP